MSERYMGQIMAECDCQHQACGTRGYCMADRIKELEGVLPEDNRPCSTDRFLVAVVDEIDDHHDRLDAIKCWIEGAWDEAVEGTTLAALKGQDDE